MERVLQYVFSMRISTQIRKSELPDEYAALWMQHWLRSHLTPLAQNPIIGRELMSLVRRLLPRYPLVPEAQKFGPMVEKDVFSRLIQYQHVYFDRLSFMAAVGFTDLAEISKSARALPLFYRYVRPHTAATMMDTDDYAEGTADEAQQIDHALERRLAILLAHPIRIPVLNVLANGSEKLSHDWQVLAALEIVREMLLYADPAVVTQTLKSLVAYMEHHIRRRETTEIITTGHVYHTKILHVRFLLGLLTLLDKSPYGLTSPPEGNMAEGLGSSIFLLALELGPNEVYNALEELHRVNTKQPGRIYLIPRQVGHAAAGDEWEYFQNLVTSHPQDPRLILIALDALSHEGRMILGTEPLIRRAIVDQVLPVLQAMRYSHRFIEFYFPR
jgi:hypothetical protein